MVVEICLSKQKKILLLSSLERSTQHLRTLKRKNMPLEDYNRVLFLLLGCGRELVSLNV